MKTFLTAALLFLGIASTASAQQVVISMDMNSGSSASVTVNQNGMIITFGGNRLYRKRIPMQAPGSVAIGSTVITNNDQSGSVTGMNPATQTLNVAVPYFGTNSYNLSQIGVTDGCNGVFCVGETVFTPSNQQGKVAGLFGDGTVAVAVPYFGTSNYAATSIGLTDACSGYFCTGDTVITDQQQTGTVSAIFADGKIAVAVPYFGTSTYAPAQLSITQAICANIYIDRVGLCR